MYEEIIATSVETSWKESIFITCKNCKRNEYCQLFNAVYKQQDSLKNSPRIFATIANECKLFIHEK
jgi:hypothetical protein